MGDEALGRMRKDIHSWWRIPIDILIGTVWKQIGPPGRMVPSIAETASGVVRGERVSFIVEAVLQSIKLPAAPESRYASINRGEVFT